VAGEPRTRAGKLAPQARAKQPQGVAEPSEKTMLSDFKLLRKISIE